jgi:hypothetical protein
MRADSRSVTGKQELILLERKLVLGTAGWGIVWRNQVPPPESLLVKGESSWLRIQPVNRVLPLTPTHELARGIDDNDVVPDRPTQSISVEDTFEQDVLLAETEPMLRRLAEKLWTASRKESRLARTVVLKLKTREFKILTRSHTPGSPPSSCEELTDIALKLRERVNLSPHQRYRLIGVGLSNFREPEDTTAQPDLFQLHP